MVADTVIWSVLTISFVALFAYVMGRKVGRREGRTAALAEAPLRLRMDALEHGQCPICSAHSGTWYNGPEEVMT